MKGSVLMLNENDGHKQKSQQLATVRTLFLLTLTVTGLFLTGGLALAGNQARGRATNQVQTGPRRSAVLFSASTSGTLASAQIAGAGSDTPTNTPVPPTATRTSTSTNTPVLPTATATCSPDGSYRVLIVYADSVQSVTLRTQLLQEPGIAVVDFIDARSSTPTLAQMQQYQIVVTFSNSSYSNSTTLGNNLANYEDGGGIVVVTTYAFVNGSTNFSIQGRWLTGGYSPYNYGPNLSGTDALGTYDASHPLMQNVANLTSMNRSTLTLATGATLVASWTDSNPLLAFKGRAIGFSAYLGNNPLNHSGQYARIIANAGRWLLPPPCAPTSTPVPPTATNTPTRKPSNTPTPTSTATDTPANTHTSTPMSTAMDTETAAPTSTETSIATSTATSTFTSTATHTSIPVMTPTCIPIGGGGIAFEYIDDYSFYPKSIGIGEGATVRWTNNGPSTHTTTSDIAVWDSGNMSTGQQFDFVFNTPGTYQYHCTLHPDMVGIITVRAIENCGSPTPSTTATATLTSTSTSTSTAQASATALQPTATACTIQYADVPPGSEFYPYIRCLACRNVANGYPCGGPGEPCDASNDGYFRQFNNVTRSQIAKMVSIAVELGEDPGPQIYADVPSSNPFYPYINRLTHRGYMNGYPCGEDGEPCDDQNRPYFRPYNNATRGQLSKIVSNAAGIASPVPDGTQTYQDVPSSNPFWLFIERLTAVGVMGGYNCGGSGEPCVPPDNRPYFRPYADVTRAQGAKIIANTFFPNCQTPARYRR